MCGLNVLVLMIATSDMYQPQKKPARGRHEGGAVRQRLGSRRRTVTAIRQPRKEKKRIEKKKIKESVLASETSIDSCVTSAFSTVVFLLVPVHGCVGRFRGKGVFLKVGGGSWQLRFLHECRKGQARR